MNRKLCCRFDTVSLAFDLKKSYNHVIAGHPGMGPMPRMNHPGGRMSGPMNPVSPINPAVSYLPCPERLIVSLKHTHTQTKSC